jgi:2-polyprenyl-3-methyl-5-hydroxy-6-metoxy-1,4-benzoquinol methylase
MESKIKRADTGGQRKEQGDQLNDDLRQRVQREQHAHTDNDVLASSYRLKSRFNHIWTYPSRRRFDETLLGYLNRLNGAKVLDYGCGRGVMSLHILAQGGRLMALTSLPYIFRMRRIGALQPVTILRSSDSM